MSNNKKTNMITYIVKTALKKNNRKCTTYVFVLCSMPLMSSAGEFISDNLFPSGQSLLSGSSLITQVLSSKYLEEKLQMTLYPFLVPLSNL